MIQNSPDRLLEGVADALATVVAPALDDPYARSQALAGAEVLRNLAPRVEWRCAHLRAVVERVGPLLERAVAAAPAGAPELAGARELLAGAPPDPGDNAALVEARRRHLAALAGVQAWLSGTAGPEAAGLREDVGAMVAWQLAEELDRLR